MSNLIQAQQELEPVKSLLVEAQEIEINSAEDIEKAGYVLKKLSDAKWRVEDLRQSMTKPLNESLRSINKFFKGFSEPVDIVDVNLRKKIRAYNEQFKKREEAPKTWAEQSLTIRNKVGGVKLKKRWNFRVVEVAKLPVEFIKPDEVKIRQAMNEGLRQLPGVEFFEDEIVSL